jgi:glycopeptide antibiotics resistance protein
MKIILILLIVVCISAVFYFSWLPNPDLATEIYLPYWIIEWSNYYHNLRTAVPFIALGFLFEIAIYLKNPIGNSKSRVGLFIQNMSISASVVCIAEGGQFLLHNRNPDFMDVFFGIVGSAVGSLGYYTIRKLLNFKYKLNEK